jgi:hypothetical protein
MVKLEFFDPSGTLEVTQQHAPRIESLAGKRIGFVRVGDVKWQTQRTLSKLRELIASDFPDAEVLPVDAFPFGNHVIPTEETAALVKASGVDAVIVGNAA